MHCTRHYSSNKHSMHCTSHEALASIVRVIKTRGEPSTWFPRERLVELEQLEPHPLSLPTSQEASFQTSSTQHKQTAYNIPGRLDANKYESPPEDCGADLWRAVNRQPGSRSRDSYNACSTFKNILIFISKHLLIHSILFSNHFLKKSQFSKFST